MITDRLLQQPDHRGPGGAAAQCIISILDEACLTVGNVTDTICLDSMDTKLAHTPTTPPASPTDKTMEFQKHFRIRHYAGDVTYSVEGFLDKNKDLLFQDFKRLMYNSADPVLKQMWPDGQLSITEVTKRPLTAATLFKNSIVALVDKLACKEPYYVRCIKPNEMKSPVLFDDARCQHQAIVNQHGFQDDVAYGHTKLFVRTPRSLFTLEQERAALIPILVLFLQKSQCRLMKTTPPIVSLTPPPVPEPAGVAGALARMRCRRMRAIYTIMGCYKRYKVKSHFWEVERRWWARQIVKNIPPSDMLEVRAKVAALTALSTDRKDWGVSRAWERDYLSNVRDCPRTSSAFIRVSKELRNKDEFAQVIFSGFCRKFTGVSVTSGVDQMVALHTSSEDDVLMCLQRGELSPNQDRVGELVGALVDHFTRIRPLLQDAGLKRSDCISGLRSLVSVSGLWSQPLVSGLWSQSLVYGLWSQSLVSSLSLWSLVSGLSLWSQSLVSGLSLSLWSLVSSLSQGSQSLVSGSGLSLSLSLWSLVSGL
ncbi:hypothetical protein INR49_002815, partial [Caranx melampygus]